MEANQTVSLKAIRQRVNGDAVAPSILIEYLGKDCSGIVAEYLRPDRLPFVDELLAKTYSLDLAFTVYSHELKTQKGFRIANCHSHWILVWQGKNGLANVTA